MRQGLIESYINQLRVSLGLMRQPVNGEELERLFEADDYAGMLRCIQTTLLLGDLTLRLGLVNSGGPKAPAWVDAPLLTPPYGSAEFRNMKVTVYVRRTFLADAPFESVVVALAHELTHVVLDAIGHPLRKEEVAVDLAAMLLGFRDFYVTGCRLARVTDPLLNGGRGEYSQWRLGYMDREEVGHAATYMTYR